MIKKFSARLGFLFLVSLSMQACLKAPVSTGLITNVQVNVDANNLLPPIPNGYSTVNLVSNNSNYGHTRIDTNLVNAWGLAFSPSGALFSANNATGTCTIYDKNGSTVSAPVTIPSPGMTTGGAPTGIVLNTTHDFKVGKVASQFIFVNEDGVISASIPGSKAAVTVADQSDMNAVYKGVAIANVGMSNFIYACNFHAGTIDVFDASFNMVSTMQFQDMDIPAGYAPFNIQNIGNKLYVLYAKQKGPENHDDQNGPGNGYVDIFNTDGTLVKRFASRGTLNSPWGIAQAPAGFGQGANAILIGNFGDGKINVYDANGTYKGQLNNRAAAQTFRSVIVIDGLWALSFQNNNGTGGDPSLLFFSAGPNGTANGLLGYFKKQ